MAIWDKLKNVLNIGADGVQIEPVIIGEKQYQVPDSRLKMGLSNLKNAKNFLFDKIGGITDKVGNKVENALFGNMVEPAIKTTEIKDDNGNTVIASGVATPTRKGGILTDLIGGFRENRDNAFNPNNLMADKNKGFVYRLGEGLGSLARIGESPLGRGLLVGGAVSALGGSGGDALAYGLGTTAQNQQLKSNDRLYRNNLAEQGINTNGIRGYISPQSYNAMLQAKQLQDNAAYRQMYYDTQKENNKILSDLNREKFEYQKRQDAIENALKSRGLDIKEKGAETKLSSKDLTTYRDNMATLKDINAGLELIEKNPNAYSLVKGALPAWATNRIDPKGISTRTQIDNITAVYRKWLTGAQMSDAERKAYERFLPAPTDNYQTVKAKLQGMRDSIERKNNILLQGAGEYQQIAETVQQDSLGIL